MKKFNKILLIVLLLTFPKVCLLHAALIPMDSQVSAILSYDDANNIMHFPANLDIRGSSDAYRIIKYNAAGGVNITSGTITGITNLGASGGTITGITDLAVADGGTGASTAGQARINLGFAGYLKGDATDVRVLRSGRFNIVNGTDPNTIGVDFSNIWNSDDIDKEDNLALDSNTVSFNLSADGSAVKVYDSAITGSCVGIICATVALNTTGLANLSVIPYISGNGLAVTFLNSATHVYYNLVSISSGGIYVYIAYVTTE